MMVLLLLSCVCVCVMVERGECEKGDEWMMIGQ